MRRLAAIGAVLLVSGTAWAAVDITSPDGTWRATVENEPGRIGQVTSLFINNVDTVFETLHYLELQDGRGSVRVEGTGEFTNEFFRNDANSFEGRMQWNRGPLSINVFGQMLNGPSGGLQLDIQYENKGTDVLSFKPFYYVDFDVAGAGSDSAAPVDWNGDGVVDGWRQSDAGIDMWFISKKSIKSMEVQPFPRTRDWLDGGASQLRDIFEGGPADLAGALSQDKIVLEPGQTHTWSFGIGGAGIPEPATLSLLALGGLALLRRR